MGKHIDISWIYKYQNQILIYLFYASTRIRTGHRSVYSRWLYQLSYGSKKQKKKKKKNTKTMQQKKKHLL